MRQNFTVTDNEFVTQTLHDAYDDLQQSKDPAVQYYIRTLTYLPKGSQLRNPDAVAEIEWYNDKELNQSRGGMYICVVWGMGR